MLYVSLHVPKTGGNTFRQILEQRFGDKLQLAYDKRDNNPIIAEPECIHGHAVFRDFAHVIESSPKRRYLTFLRDPLRSAISHYFFVKKWSPVNHRGEPQEFDDRGLDVWLTHEEEFRWPNPPGYNHNRYSKWFEKHPIEEYDFIGMTDQYDESLLLMYHQFAWERMSYRRDNVGSYVDPPVAEAVVARFKDLNAEDHRLFDHALARLAEAREGYGSSFESDLAAFRKQLQQRQTSEPEN